MIRNFKQFVNENLSNKSIGEWIETVSKDNEYLLNLISSYTQDIDPSIRIANSINMLNEYQINELYKKIKSYLSGEDDNKEVDITASVDSSEILENYSAGKNIFKSFLKIITAMGLKEHKPDWNKTPDDFLIYFLFENIDVEKFKSVASRFKSIQLFLDSMDYTKNLCNLYFGIKADLVFEYGIESDKKIPIGNFKLNKSTHNWIMLLDSVSAAPLKKQLIDLDINKIILFSKIKTAMTTFKPGHFEKKAAPQIQGDVISFSYYGMGKWENGKMNDVEVEAIKNNFKSWLSKFRWSEKILVSVTNKSFWINFNFKLK